MVENQALRQKIAQAVVPNITVNAAGINYGYMEGVLTRHQNDDFKFEKKETVSQQNIIKNIFVNQKTGLELICEYELVDGCLAARQRNKLINRSNEPITVTHITSGRIEGVCDGGSSNWFEEGRATVNYCLSCWQGEAQWRKSSLKQLGIYPVSTHANAASFSVSSEGSWSTAKYYPCVVVEDNEIGKAYFMEIEAGFNWAIEIGNDNVEGEFGSLYITANSADTNRDGWYITLEPDQEYITSSVIFGTVCGDFEAAAEQIITFKRATDKAKTDTIPVAYNTYMNGIWSAPTDKNLIPLIDAAADAGAEVFCIDSGWYSSIKNERSLGMGDWNIADDRFGDMGLKGIFDYIIQKGMKPGVWFEFECCQSVSETYKNHKEYLLFRNGEILGGERAFFDFKNIEVRKFITDKVQTLYNLGLRFIKNDYNQTTGIGFYEEGKSLPEALIQNTRAFYSFINELKQKFPDLVIENCGSGAMRSDNATLENFELQSTSDQEIYYRNPAIISGSLGFMMPEKAGIWSYPYPIYYGERLDGVTAEKISAMRQKYSDGEETIFNMVNGCMGSMYLSGRIDLCDAENSALIKEAIAAYKGFRGEIKTAVPFWPSGRFSLADQGIFAFGLRTEQTAILAVWRIGGNDSTATIKLDKWLNGQSELKQIYPVKDNTFKYSYDSNNQALSVDMPKAYMARLFKIKL